MITKPCWEKREEKITEVRNLEKIYGMRKGRKAKEWDRMRESHTRGEEK